jgi:hypothetical protein
MWMRPVSETMDFRLLSCDPRSNEITSLFSFGIRGQLWKRIICSVGD